MDGENRPSKTASLKPAWQPGQSGNPAGRPKGARNKLGEQFVKDMLADWETNGAKVIATVRDERPADYLKVVASILPKEVSVTVNEYDDLTDEELAEQFAAVAGRLVSSTATGQRIRAALEGQGGKGSLPN